MLIQGQVGPQQNNTDGSNPTVRMGRQGEMIVSNLHGKYYEQAYRGNLFYVASQAGQITTVGLSATYTGLVLSNPIGSTVNLSMLKASWNQSVIQGTTVAGYSLAIGTLISTQVTHSSAVTTQSCLAGSGRLSVARADSQAALQVAPVYAMHISNSHTSILNNPGGVVDLDGCFVITPGSYIMWATPAISPAAAMWFSFLWEEVPV